MFKRIIVAVMILTAAIFSTVSAESAKSDQWLIYWYVCGTDIETTRIAFEASTDLMSNDTNKLVLAEPDRRPGDATRSIKEVEKADLSPNVKIFMQAGGTYIWGHEKFRDLNAKIQTDVTAYNRNDDVSRRFKVLFFQAEKFRFINGSWQVAVEVTLLQHLYKTAKSVVTSTINIITTGILTNKNR